MKSRQKGANPNKPFTDQKAFIPVGSGEIPENKIETQVSKSGEQESPLGFNP